MKKSAVYTRLGLLAGIATCVVGLSACRSASNTSHWSYASESGRLTAEDLLDSEGGNWKMVEEEEDSPMALHAMAKKGQNPRNMRGMKHEGADYELAGNGEQTYRRTVRLVREGGKAEDEDIQLAGLMPARTDLIMDSGVVPPTPEMKPGFANPPSLKLRGTGAMPDKPEFEMAQADAAEVILPAVKPDFEAQHFAGIEPAAGHTAGHIEISKLRFGTHPGKVRMVMDVSGPASFRHNVDNNARALSIEVEDSEWDAGKESEMLNSPLIEGYRAVREGSVTRIDLTLKKPVKVLWAAALKPESGKGNRLVFDLAAL